MNGEGLELTNANVERISDDEEVEGVVLTM
jgi:hypothetical protein